MDRKAASSPDSTPSTTPGRSSTTTPTPSRSGPSPLRFLLPFASIPFPGAMGSPSITSSSVGSEGQQQHHPPPASLHHQKHHGDYIYGREARQQRQHGAMHPPLRAARALAVSV